VFFEAGCQSERLSAVFMWAGKGPLSGVAYQVPLQAAGVIECFAAVVIRADTYAGLFTAGAGGCAP